jgi:acetyltransferase
MIAAQMAFAQVAFMNEAFHSAPSAAVWLRVSAVALTASLIVGFEKWVRGQDEKTTQSARTPAAATTKSAMRTAAPQKLERVHDIFRERRPALETMLAPKSVAVIGATEAEGSIGRTLMENLKAGSFGGEIIPVNPKRARVLGIPAFPKVGAVENPIDLAVIVTPAAAVPGIIGECVEADVKGAIIISAGFRECGEAGVELEKQVLAQTRRGRMRIIGPNCLGVMRPHAGLNATFATSMAQPGSVGFISQSGALCTAILDWSLRENVGFSAFGSARCSM